MSAGTLFILLGVSVIIIVVLVIWLILAQVYLSGMRAALRELRN